MGQSTFEVSGTLATAEIADGSVTAIKTKPDAHFYAAGTLSGGVYTITLNPALASYITGHWLSFKADAANAGAVDLNVNALGAKNLVKFVDTASTPQFVELAAGDIRAGMVVDAQYDGTQYLVRSRLCDKEVEYVTAAGTNTYTATPSPAYTVYTQLTGKPVVVSFTNANTGASTINLNGLGAKSIYKYKDQELVTGDIKATHLHILIYDGTAFQIQIQASVVYQETTVTDAGGALSASGATLRTITAPSFTPKFYRLVALCTTSESGVNGYIVNDEVDFPGGFIYHGSGGGNYDGANVASVYLSGSNIKVAIHDQDPIGDWNVCHKTTGALSNVTRTSWTLKAYCYG